MEILQAFALGQGKNGEVVCVKMADGSLDFLRTGFDLMSTIVRKFN
jgi:hypothetical protein